MNNLKKITPPFFVLVAAFFLLLSPPINAQTFTTLHHFTRSTNPTNSDGGNPFSGLISSNEVLYGTTMSGGVFGHGAVFKINTDGSGYTNLHSFAVNNEGRNPQCNLILDGNTLYGTTYQGKSVVPAGTVFRVNTDGTGFTNLHSFTNIGGGSPAAGLTLFGNTLFGTTETGGSFGNGEVFRINTDGSGFTTLHSFTALINSTNGDGAFANGGVVQYGSALFGTTEKGGVFGKGTIYRINTDGTGFTNLHSFDGIGGGAAPFASMILSGDTLYGTSSGLNTSSGSIFRIAVDGNGFTNLHNFAGSGASAPWGALLLMGDTLYGTTTLGGAFGRGTIFAVKTNGADFTRLYSFHSVNSSTNSDGTYPSCNLICAGEKLYGTAYQGGASGYGTVFSFTLPPPKLEITHSFGELIFRWSTNLAGLYLQAATNLVPPIVWDTNLPAPRIVNSRNTVTIPISETQAFYRLAR